MLDSPRRLSPFGFRAPQTSARPPRDIATLGAVVLVGLHLALLTALYSRPGVVATVLWYVGPSLLAALAGALLLVALIASMRHRLTWSRDRVLRYLLLVAVTAAPMIYRTYPSSHDGQPSSERFVLPMAGPVTVAWGGEDRDVNSHVLAPDQRWGFDLLVTVDRRSFRSGGAELGDYFAYGREVFSPSPGTVVVVHDAEPDVPIRGQSRGDDLGNHVAIEVAEDEVLYLAHLQPGSISVQVGDRVAPGDPIGRIGNSGKSAEPHLHIHLQDSIRRHLAEGVPFEFFDYCQGGTRVPEGLPEGGQQGVLWTGAIVSNAPPGGCSTAETAANSGAASYLQP